jgi:hypothetical protein
MPAADSFDGRKIVVCVSWEPSLAATRELLLVQIGCRVVSLIGPESEQHLEDESAPDLLVLGQSIPPVSKKRIARLFRQGSKAPILSLLRPHQQRLAEADFAVEALTPEDLVRTVKQILCN